ncbi:MAG: chorismate mutase [Janthinobacterium lividum]
MSPARPVPTLVTAPAAAGSADLAQLRAELDRLDDSLHDLLMRRSHVVEQVGALGVKGRVPLRPGREASIVRRLADRHQGSFPVASLVLLWRELICGMTALQRPLRIAVCDTTPDAATVAATREHFGALVPLRAYTSPAQAIHEISTGLATAAVLPLPQEGETPRQAWWTALLHRDDPRIHIVARLPFLTTRPEGAPQVQAFVVTAAAPDPSGADRSLLGLELALESSRARLGADLAAAGFTAGTVLLRRDPGAASAYALVDVEGFVPDGDPRLATLSAVLRPPVVLGAYAVPLEIKS